MIITVELSSETVAVLRPIAERKGLDLSELVADFAEREAATHFGPSLESHSIYDVTAPTTNEKLSVLREMRERAARRDLVPLPDDAYERAALNEDEER